MGGYDGQQYLQDVECYDPVSNDWDKVKLYHYLRQKGFKTIIVSNIRSGSESGRGRGEQAFEVDRKVFVCVCVGGEWWQAYEVDRIRFSVHKSVLLHLLIYWRICTFMLKNLAFSIIFQKNSFHSALFKWLGGGGHVPPCPWLMRLNITQLPPFCNKNVDILFWK